jgi:hypothetical protein
MFAEDPDKEIMIRSISVKVSLFIGIHFTQRRKEAQRRIEFLCYLCAFA